MTESITEKMAKLVLVFFAIFAVFAVRCQQDDECPERNGKFADSVQCDRYYECVDFELTEQLCPDGLVFSDETVGSERCDYPFNVDCTGRNETQQPQVSSNCPRANGYFVHPDPTVCDKFYFCSDGQFNLITCSAGLVFDPTSGVCQYPGEANRQGCKSSDVVEFQCPEPELSSDSSGPVVANPLYPDPTDCQFFYICINNKEPRRNGCPIGTVFNSVSKKCDNPKNVPDCVDWYKVDSEEEGSVEEE